jgi:hypothetical protein
MIDKVDKGGPEKLENVDKGSSKKLIRVTGADDTKDAIQVLKQQMKNFSNKIAYLI